MRHRNRQPEINRLMLVLFDHFSEDVQAELDDFSGGLGRTLIDLDKIVNQGQGFKAYAKELEHFRDHKRSLNNFVEQGK